MRKQKGDLRLWVIMAISLAGLIYNIVSGYAIRGNELKHINQTLNDVRSRVERIENMFLKGDLK